MRNDDRIWGLEEFSVQKPIARNYTYEYLFHKLLGHVGLININYFFINLFINDQNHGVYAVEESFSKELVERQKKRNGPIFSLKDEMGEYFPNVKYELYSENFWQSEYPKLTKDLFSSLNNLKGKNFEINNLDANIIIEKPKIKKFKDRIVSNIAKLCKIPLTRINIKGKTADNVGIFGKSEAIGCWATINIIN